MANITEVSQWENVIRQLENGEAATGGADGLANVQAKQLANRTKWLKDNLAPIVNATFSGTLKHGCNDLAGSAIVAKSISWGNGYIKYASGLIIQWGRFFTDTSPSGSTVKYPISFTKEPKVIANVHNCTPDQKALGGLEVRCFNDDLLDGFVVYHNLPSSGTWRMGYIAIGI